MADEYGSVGVRGGSGVQTVRQNRNGALLLLLLSCYAVIIVLLYCYCLVIVIIIV